MLRDVEVRGGHAHLWGVQAPRGGWCGPHRSNRRGILALHGAVPRRRLEPGDQIDRARTSRSASPRPGRGVGARRRPAAGSSRRSSPGRCATASRRASTAATSSRSTSPGRVIRQLGDPDRLVTLRSTVKPFALLALIEAGGIKEFDLEPAELAVMASSHSGEDLHVRTLQGLYRRSGVSARRTSRNGSEGAPLDALTAARLARDGEKAGPDPPHVLRRAHRLPAAVPAERLGPDRLLEAEPPVAGPASARRSRACSGRRRGSSRPPSMAAGSRPSPSTCARSPAPTRCWPTRRRSRPATLASGLAGSLTIVRDAMLANPELVGGRHDRLDTSLMKAAPGRLVAKGGAEALRGRRDPARRRGPGRASPRATGMAVKIEDGDGYDRGTWAASVEALRQAGVARQRAPCASSPATTARRSSTRTAGSAPRRSPSSSWRRSASSSADRPGRPARRTAAGVRPSGRHDGHRPGSVPHARACPGRLDRRDQARLPPAGQDPPPRRGRREERAAVPGHPGGLRAARRRAGGQGTGAGGRPAPRKPWEADPDRSDATRRAYGGRARGPAPGRPGPPGGRRRAVRRVGRRRLARAPDGAGREREGRRRSHGRGRRGRAVAGSGRSGSGADRRTRTGARAQAARAGSGHDAGAGARRRAARGARKRNKATLGSTSYDGVEGPFEPDWRGASWYGTTSGTYWTLNPKEYADPRKHGPEYQARARRATRRGAPGMPGRRATRRTRPHPADDPTESAAQPPARDRQPPAGPTHTTSSWWESTAGRDRPSRSRPRTRGGRGRPGDRDARPDRQMPRAAADAAPARPRSCRWPTSAAP